VLLPADDSAMSRATKSKFGYGSTDCCWIAQDVENKGFAFQMLHAAILAGFGRKTGRFSPMK
jgi:hypothetical protein